MDDFKCPKCDWASGDDYAQCHGKCPIEGTAWFDQETHDKYYPEMAVAIAPTSIVVAYTTEPMVSNGRLIGRHAQCEVPIASPTWNPTWRERRYGSRGLDPAKCAHQAYVIINGRKLCKIHGGQEAIRILLGESPHG